MTTPDTVLFNDAEIEEDNEEPTAVDTLITRLTAEARQDPPDPFGVDGADVKVGDLFRAHDEPTCNQRLAGAPGGSYAYCRRPAGHDPRHPHFETDSTSARFGGMVTWVWGKGEAPLPETPAELRDPDDAKLESFEVGTFASYRDKRRALVIVSRPRKRDDDVEVLDLTHRRFMKIRKEHLVPRRDDDPAITAEEFQWVGQWLAERRKKAREVATRELSNGRWDRATMNQSLEMLDIEPVPAVYGGDTEFTIHIRFPGGVQPTREEARRIIQRAIVREHEGVTVTRISNWYGPNVREIAG